MIIETARDRMESHDGGRMSWDGDEETYCRRQAARSRRLAHDIAYGYPDMAKALESLAVEFEERAERIKTQAGKP